MSKKEATMSRSTAKGLISGNLLSDLFERLSHPAAALHRLKAGEALFAAGDAGDGCYRLEKGLLKVEVASTSGEQRIIALFSPGAIVGELSMIDGQPRSASVVALSDCLLRFVSRKAFKLYMLTHPETYEELVSILSARMREADQTIADATFLSVKGRVVRALLELAEHVGESTGRRIVLKHKIARCDLAAMAGVARENVSRVLSELRRRCLVTLSDGYYSLNDMGALQLEVDFHEPRRVARSGLC
jgi:CRP/FNR family transcriptional regulator